MSADDEGEGTPLIRMVTAPYRSRPDEEMNLIGLLYGLLLVIVLLPLLPFFVLVWALSGLRDALVGVPEAET